jgi:pantetheine-phosphate adenylyltransferase
VRRAVCPGSFDPVTNGHLEIISRAAALVDELRVLVASNPAKRHLFTAEERVQMVREATKGRVVVESFEGLLVDYCRTNGVQLIVKGLRDAADFGYEKQMAQMNTALAGVETVFLATGGAYDFVSSSLVKQVATFGEDVSSLVPALVSAKLKERLDRDPA